MVAVIGIVTGAVPQLNVMMPPLVTAVFRALNVQLAAVPVPTTDVGLDTFTGCARAGSALVHCCVLVEPPVPVAPPVAVLPPVALAPPVEDLPPVGLAPPLELTPPVGLAPPVELLPPDALAPPVEFLPPVGLAPPVVDWPPVAAVPPVAVLPPTCGAPALPVVPPVAELPPVALPPADEEVLPPVAVTPPVAPGALPPVPTFPPTAPSTPGEPEQPAVISKIAHAMYPRLEPAGIVLFMIFMNPKRQKRAQFNGSALGDPAFPCRSARNVQRPTEMGRAKTTCARRKLYGRQG